MLQAVKNQLKLNEPALLRHQSYVNGAWIDGSASFKVTNPADGAVSAPCRTWARPRRRKRSTPRTRPFPAGPPRPARSAPPILRKWFDLMMADADDLAALMTAEHGKPVAEARGEMPTARASSNGSARRPSASTATSFHDRRDNASGAEAADRRLCGDHAVEFPDRDDHAQGRRRRWPPAAPSCQAGRADAAVGAGAGRAGGARRRARPASSTSSPATPSAIGAAVLVRDPLVRKLSFTGSTEVGRMLMRSARRPSRSCRWSWAATRRSSCSTTPTSTPRSRARWPPSSATAGQTCVCANRI